MGRALRRVDPLQAVLAQALRRSLARYSELDLEDDFFEAPEAPDIPREQRRGGGVGGRGGQGPAAAGGGVTPQLQSRKQGQRAPPLPSLLC